LHDKGMTYAQIGNKYGVSRQSVQNLLRRTYGAPGRRPVDKPRDAVHMAEVRVHEAVHEAAMARLDAVCDELNLIGSSRPTLSALCRELMAEPLDAEAFPQLDQPFASNPPGSRKGAVQVVRWRDNWGRFSDAQTAIHERGYSVSQVVEHRLRSFALSGKLPGVLRYHQTGDET
jgi:hypothetical protein